MKIGIHQRALILIAFGLSGMAALMYEIVWIRPLQLIFGSTVYALSTMLTAFLAGLSLGSLIYGKKVDSIKSPLLLAVKIEVMIGVYGLFVPLALKILPYVYRYFFDTPVFLLVQFVLSFTVILIPATLIGAMWPLVGQAYIDETAVGRNTGLLYSSNAAGSALGPLLVGFVLIPTVGVIGAAIVAAILNLLAATILLVAIKGGGRSAWR